MGFFWGGGGGAHELAGAKRSLLPNICHIYTTMMKLDINIYLT